MNNMDELDAIIDATESMAQSIEHLMEQMNDFLPSCEMGKVSNYECDKMAEYELQLQQNYGITLTIIVCENCMKILHNHANN
tara:strand:+ start:1873 stop:2118 length:246 start_codon:yes stop_codon:yes gene_type:complete